MIGRLRKVPVSEMFEAGGSNFVAWLQENIDVLNEAAGLSLSGMQDVRSASAAGLVAREGSGGMAVIENEPGESDDGSLGRLIISLASMGAQTGIWIVADFRPEHVAAVSWLNETSQVSFYLCKVEAFRIDDSLPAPLVSLIVGPEPGNGLPSEGGLVSETSDIVDRFEIAEADPVAEAAPARSVVDASPASRPLEPVVEEVPIAEELSDPASREAVDTRAPSEAPSGRDATSLTLYQFWTELLGKARQRSALHAEVEPQREAVVGANAGVEGFDYNYVLREHDASVELRIDRGEGRESENETVFNAFRAAEDAIVYNFGGPLRWEQDEASGARRIEHRIEIGGYRDEERWPELQDAMIDAMTRLERATRPHVSRLQLR